MELQADPRPQLPASLPAKDCDVHSQPTTQDVVQHGSDQDVQPPSNSPVSLPPRQVCTEWIDAAKAGDCLELRRLLRTWPALLDKQVGGLQCTATHWAAANGHDVALQLLVQAGADVTLQTSTGCLPLHSAAAAGRAECVQELLATDAALQQHQLAAVNEDGLTPAALALRHGHKVVQGQLMNAAAAQSSACGAPAAQQSLEAVHEQQQQQQQGKQQGKQQGMRRGFLLMSAGGPSLPAQHKLGEQQQQQQKDNSDSHSRSSSSSSQHAVPGSLPQAEAPEDSKVVTAQGTAAVQGAADGDKCWDSTVDNPLFGVACSPMKQQHGTDQHAQHVISSSCLSAATTSGAACVPVSSAHAAETAAASTADSTELNQTHTTHKQQQQHEAKVAPDIDRVTGRSWLDAARAGDLQRLQQLLQQEAGLLDYRGRGTSYAFVGNSALHWAAAKGHLACVTWLLQAGASVAAGNEAGATALHTAVEHGQPACAEVLVLLGDADVQLADGYGQAALTMAAAGGSSSSGSRGAGGALAQQLLLWQDARKLYGQDRSVWTNTAMQRLLQLAGKASEAAKCLEKSELLGLTEEVLKGVMCRVVSA